MSNIVEPRLKIQDARLTASPQMLRIQDLTFNYPTGSFVLDIPSFQIEAGERVAVIGPSGSGKTTLLNIIAGILVPRAGQVLVDEARVDVLSDAERRNYRITNIGFVFQDFELLGYLNVIDNIIHPYRITSALKLNKDIRRRATALAERMGIADKLKRNANDLSQGEKQRAAICRALLPEPKLILADEATGNLDPENKTLILDLLFEAVADHDATVLAVTHDHELLPRFDRVVDYQDFRSSRSA